MTLDEAFLREWTARLRDLPGPRVLAIYLRGSHAQGLATEYSDVDFDVLVEGSPEGGAYERFPAWLVPHEEGLRHVSVSVTDAEGFLRELAEPARWAFGWPVSSPIRPLWIDPSRPDLRLHAITHPAGEPLLEEAIEDLSKIASALTRGNETGVLVASADLAREVPTLLRLANPPRVVEHRLGAWDAALTMPVTPYGYRDHLGRCLGWTEATVRERALSAYRLLSGTLPLIRPYANAFDAMGDLGAALRDRRLDRYVAQLGAPLVAPASERL
jgi:phosphoribosyl-AMP cyclohydrolase